MIEKLTTSHNRPVWINLAHVLRIERMTPVQDGYPATKVELMTGVTIDVFESPEEIATLANATGVSDDGRI